MAMTKHNLDFTKDILLLKETGLHSLQFHFFPKIYPSNKEGLGIALQFDRYLSHYWKDAHHYDIMEWEHFPHYWPFVRGMERWLEDWIRKGSVMRKNLLNKLINYQSSCQWFKTHGTHVTSLWCEINIKVCHWHHNGWHGCFQTADKRQSW